MTKKINTELTEQHIKFVDEYVKTNDAYIAATKAGVKPALLDATVSKWTSHPKIIAAVEAHKASLKANTSVSGGWIVGELKEMYTRARDDGDNVNALKALDMLGKHVGLYAADKQPMDKPVTVVITNYAGVKIENNDDGTEIN